MNRTSSEKPFPAAAGCFQQFAMGFPSLIGAAQIWRGTALTACVVIAVAVFAAPGPNTNLRSAIAIHDFGHVVAFGLVTALFAFALSVRSRPKFQGRIGAICLAAGAALALGTVVELAQAMTGVHGDPWDAVRDGGGALSVALILITLDSGISSRVRVALVVVAVFVLAAFSYPVFAALNDEARARAQFPILAAFETTEELSRFFFRQGMTPKLIRTIDDEGRRVSAVQLKLPPGKYPGFELRYFPRDWRGMQALELLIVNPEPMLTEVTVRVDDNQYRRHLDDRYNRSFPLSLGINRIEIPLSEVAAAPRGRQFDLGSVHSLLVYAVDLEKTFSIIVGPIRLLR